MCGIVGVISDNKENLGKVCLGGLKKLEYRGYDSWGIAIDTGDGVVVVKKAGKIGQVKDIDIEGKLGIGHTRWATHGNVSDENAHPHTSYNNKVWVVHNGIVENYEQLKKELEEEGIVVKTQTDTEIIAHLIAKNIEREREVIKGVRMALNDIKGSYALLILIDGYPNIIAASLSSPLLVGRGDSKIYFASDVRAFLNDIKEVGYFNDYEMCVANSKDIRFYSLKTGEEIKKGLEKVDKEKYEEDKGKEGWEHYTIKEIIDQKTIIKEGLEYNKEKIKKVAEEINNAFGVFFIASGTSLNAAIAASYLFSKYAHKHVNVVDASEFEYHKHFITPKTLVIAISQSGETADVIEAVKVAKNKGAKVISIVNVYGSTLMRLSDDHILMRSGFEVSVVATKTYTSQLAILLLLVFGTINLYNEGMDMLLKAQDQIKNILASEEFFKKMKKIASKISNKQHIYLLGRGVSYATALEGALKIKEISYIHAEAFAGGALKHGSIALIEKDTPVVVIAPDDETYEQIISNAQEVKARGAFVIGISPKNSEVFDEYIEVPNTNGTSPLINIIPLQVLAYYLSVMRNLDPDKPRNLAKSVTVK